MNVLQSENREKTRTKILFLIPSLRAGGSERVFSVLANHLDREKFDINIVTLDGSEAFYKIRQEVRLTDLKTPRVRQAVVKIFKLIRAEKPHIVVSTLTHLNLFLALIKPVLPRKTRFIARESTILSAFHATESHTKLRNLAVKLFYTSFDLLICQSNQMATDLEKNYFLPKSRLKTINNPIHTEGVLQGVREGIVTVRNAQFRFVSIGRLSAEKGLDSALKALATLENVDFEYLIIGEGKERTALEQQAAALGIADRVVFLGSLKNPFGWLASADLLLLPSHFEGFPNVLLEAGTVGTPAVAFACGGVSAEIIEDNKTGFVVKDGDTAALSAAILRGCSTVFDRDYIQQQTANRFGIAAILAQFDTTFLTV